MLHAPVLRRHFSLYTRVPYARIAESAARDGHSKITIQRYRVHRPFFTKSRYAGFFFVTGTLLLAQQYLGISFEVVSDEKSTLTKKGVRSGDNSDNGQDSTLDNFLLFLRIGLPREGKRTLYQPTDPEWAEYRKIASDEAYANKLRTRFAALIREHAISAGYEKPCGKIDRSKGREWLEIHIPAGPPPECLVPGVALTADMKFVVTTRPIKTEHAQKIHRILKPTYVLIVLYFDAKDRIGKAWHRLKVRVGWEEEKAPNTTLASLASLRANGLSNPKSVVSSTGTPSPAKPSQQTTSPSPPTEFSLFEYLTSYLPDPNLPILDMTYFTKTMDAIKLRRPPTMVRGCVQVKGMVELYGTRNRIVFHTIAVIDPRTNIIHQVNLVPYHLTPNRSASK